MYFKSTYFLFTKNRCALSNRKLRQMLKLAKTWQAQQPQQSACLLMSSQRTRLMKFFPPEIKSYQISAHGGLRSPIGAAKVGGGGLIKVGQRRRMNIIMREVRVTSIINHGRGGASSIHPARILVLAPGFAFVGGLASAECVVSIAHRKYLLAGSAASSSNPFSSRRLWGLNRCHLRPLPATCLQPPSGAHCRRPSAHQCTSHLPANQQFNMSKMSFQLY